MVNDGGDHVNSNLKREILNSIAAEYGWKNYLPTMMKIVSVTPKKAKRFTGRYYVSEDNVMEIKETDGKLAVQSPDRGIIDVFPISDEELVAKSVLPFRFKLMRGKELLSANTYDSLGEGYMKAGDKELAIENYEKSLVLNPANENAKKMLEELRAK